MELQEKKHKKDYRIQKTCYFYFFSSVIFISLVIFYKLLHGFSITKTLPEFENQGYVWL